MRLDWSHYYYVVHLHAFLVVDCFRWKRMMQKATNIREFFPWISTIQPKNKNLLLQNFAFKVAVNDFYCLVTRKKPRKKRIKRLYKYHTKKNRQRRCVYTFKCIIFAAPFFRYRAHGLRWSLFDIQDKYNAFIQHHKVVVFWTLFQSNLSLCANRVGLRAE